MTTVSDALRGITLLGVDSSPFIYFVEGSPHYYDLVESIFAYVDDGKLSVITSSLTLTEVLTIPLKTGNAIYLSNYRDMLLNTINIITEPVTIAIAEQAAQLRAKYKIKTPDAIIISTAIASGCDALLTNDKQLRQVTEIKIIVLDELDLDPTI